MSILRSISDSFSTRLLYVLIAGFCLLVILPSRNTVAQNQPIYNQFFLNPFIYNPAYAGKNPNAMGFFNYRQQWVGIDGAPTSYTFMLDTELKKNVSFGLIVQNDTRGVISTSSGQFTIGYGIKFSNEHGLRFGLSAGAGTNSLDLDEGFSDIAIQNVLDNNFFLSGRVGLNYYYKNFNLSFSLPDIFKRQLISTSDLSPIELDPLDNYIAMASARFDLIPKTLSFSPNILYRGTSDGTSYVEAMGTFDIKELLWIGGSYRQNYGITGLAGIKVKNYVTIGYGYEIPTAELAGLSNSTHEVQVSIRMGKDKVKEAEEKKARIAAKREKQRSARAAFAKKQAEEKIAKEELEAKNRAEELEVQREKDEAQKIARELEEQKDEETQVIEEGPIKKETTLATEKSVDDEEPIVQTEPVVEQKTVVVEKGNNKDELDEDHYVIVGSFNSKEHAVKMTNQLKSQGHSAGYGYSTAKQRYYVYLHKSSSADNARTQRDKYRNMNQFKDAWHLEVQVNDLKEIGKAKDNTKNQGPVLTEPVTKEIPNVQKPVVVKKGDHMLELKSGHYIVIGAFSGFENAEKFSNQIHGMGHKNSFGYASEKKLYYIYLHNGDSADETRLKRDEFRKIKAFNKAWYLLVED